MEGGDHWVGGSQPRGLIPPWCPCVDHEPMHSSIGACHNIGSCGPLFLPVRFRQAIRCFSRSPQRLVRPRIDYPLCGADEFRSGLEECGLI